MCCWRTTNKKKPATTKAGVQSGGSPSALTLSQGCLWQCGGQAVPFHTEAGHRVWDSEPVSSGIQSWSDVKEEGTMEPATWCSEVPHLQWWCSTRSCLHNYGSSICHVNIKKWWMCIFAKFLMIITLGWVCIFSPCVRWFPQSTQKVHQVSWSFLLRTMILAPYHVALSPLHRFAG